MICVVRQPPVAGQEIVRFDFRTADEQLYNVDLFGALYRATAKADFAGGTGGVGETLAVRVLDEFGADVLAGQAAAVDPNGSVNDLDLSIAVDSRGDRMVAVAGQHSIGVVSSAGTIVLGQLKLYMMPFAERLRTAAPGAARGAIPERAQPDVLYGSVVHTVRSYLGLDVHRIAWKSDATGGNVEAIVDVRGIIDRIVTVPSTPNPPTDLYDVTIDDFNGLTIASAPDRSATVVEPPVRPYRASVATDRHWELAVRCPVRVKIANAGNGTEGTLGLYVLR